LSNAEAALNAKSEFFRLSSPDYILAKGYSITTLNGKALKSADTLKHGDLVETKLAKGKFSSRVYTEETTAE
jgi:exodeoxyribonuclease VII large subunit